ncbi:MAG: hypothetical protein LCH53_13725 [Bacteroidetes bacterium]|nr:hypothetical protein [Bacteroidota bacterium]
MAKKLTSEHARLLNTFCEENWAAFVEHVAIQGGYNTQEIMDEDGDQGDSAEMVAEDVIHALEDLAQA